MAVHNSAIMEMLGSALDKRNQCPVIITVFLGFCSCFKNGHIKQNLMFSDFYTHHFNNTVE